MIGIIAAMEMEKAAITARMENCKTQETAGVSFTTGLLQGKEVTVALSGVGKVAAAISATLLCQVFKPEMLIHVGVAGGLQNWQNTGDLVFSTDSVIADYDTSPVDGPEGIGQRFQADPLLLEKAQKAAEALGVKYSCGTVATTDVFLTQGENFDRLISRFPESLCAEMEGGAVAKTAAAFQIPYLIVRSLSDIVVHDNNPVQFQTFAQNASRIAADLLEQILTTA